MQIWRCFEHAAHLGAVQTAVGLGPRRLDRRAARTVKKSKLNARPVNHAAHNTAERVNLANDVSLGNTADRRVTRHLPDKVQIDRHKCRIRPKTSGGRRRLAPGMPRSDHYYIKTFVKHP